MFNSILGMARFWLTPSNWYWSKSSRRGRKFSSEYVAEAKERGLI